MRLVKANINSDGSGFVTLCPEEPEDMWHAYNLIAPNDLLRATAIRNVKETSATGSTDKKRKRGNFAIQVKNIDFDPKAGQLHIGGRIAEENELAAVGSHHTLDLELNRNFTLEKKDGWDSVARKVVQEACKENKAGTIPAVVMQEGIANICLITQHQTVLKQRVEMSVPKKRSGRSGDHDKGMTKFFEMVWETLKRQVDINESIQAGPLLLASPGFTAAAFQKYIIDEATRLKEKILLSNKGNLIVVHSGSGHVHSLNEVLKSPEVLKKLKDTKYSQETRYMDDFMTLLRKDDGRAWYGPTEVEEAVEKGAVGRGGGVLLISDALFRSDDIGTRKRWVALVEKVEVDGGEARILSSAHGSGKDLDALGGIAAILTFPMADLDGDEDGEEDDEEEVPIGTTDPFIA